MRSLFRTVQWKTEKKKVQVSVVLHCSENQLHWWQSLRSGRGCRAGSSSLGSLQAVWQLRAVCLPLALCCEPVTGGPTIFLCCYNDEQRESPPVLLLEYTSWLTVVLTGSSAFQPKITSREALLHAFAFHEGIPKYTVLWQYPCPWKSTWKVLEAVPQLLRIQNVLSGDRLDATAPVWTVPDGFADVFLGQQPPSVCLWRYDLGLPTVLQIGFYKAFA